MTMTAKTPTSADYATARSRLRGEHYGPSGAQPGRVEHTVAHALEEVIEYLARAVAHDEVGGDGSHYRILALQSLAQDIALLVDAGVPVHERVDGTVGAHGRELLTVLRRYEETRAEYDDALSLIEWP